MSQLKEIKFKCPFFENGCIDEIEYDLFESHLKECNFSESSLTKYKQIQI